MAVVFIVTAFETPMAIDVVLTATVLAAVFTVSN
jgi:hypothetical protein